ncbi:hypothetical protein KEG38_32025 [Polyangium jinanense]|uniref:hypothetical protein n=1 Tax=Polyangium jinanense TaxID=2829994 RepID=UPI0023415D03|nr:hypothetical protein [Polyangium jinanense]MDC3958528.1 hypothetical protein [Polyangium jinanense]
MAVLLWRRALDRIPAEALMEDDPGLMDALREPRFVPQGPAQEREFDLVLTIETMASCYDGQIALMSLPRWAQCGYPEIQLPETYAAALLATTVTEEVLACVRPPFRVFLIEVPNGLLTIDTEQGPSPVRVVLVHHEPKSEKWAYAAWTASPACLWRFGVTTAQLLPPSLPEHDLTEMSIFPMTVTERDERVAALIGRLIVNTCLAMSDPARVRAPAPAGPRGRRRKADARRGGEVPRTMIFRVGKPLEKDFRPAVRDYLEGRKRNLSVQTLVAGHWKMQPHGPGFSLRRLIYVEPYWRGDVDAPIHVRPIRLG